ncbi:response regulator transcription factor [Bradyrhizobium sp. MOS001]|uniref:response regulator transcription factor n=1 Tax=Bradyrhizobium sp. MOS001 TaxID=2133948 RepID=UPI0010750AA5|nr:response regulator transcription factor [Bradyrhizobium sp. MOS001]TFW56695.1 response regulator transcription factor [Bradyrhizobium sp. MOS001]
MSEHSEKPTVIVIDDDRNVREALDGLLQSVGLRAQLFASAQEFINAPTRLDGPGCLILDVRLPGQSGLDFHDDLLRANIRIPVIFISGHADVPMSVRAMKTGAVEFLTKPVRHQDLLDAIQTAISRDAAQREVGQVQARIQVDYESLTPRERGVFSLVVAGSPNKRIAEQFGISIATVKLHRGNVMRKMRAHSLAELIRIADKLPKAGSGTSTLG